MIFPRRFSKKASLNLSIEAIVVVVIAFTVLGLGLGFVKEKFKSFSDTSTQVSSQIKDQILENMRSSGKKLSVDREVIMERGDTKVVNIGVVNTGTATATFGINIIAMKKQNIDGTAGDKADMPNEVTFFYNELVDKELSPTDGDVIPITITTTGSASGNYLYQVKVLNAPLNSDCITGNEGGCTAYDSTTFFVRVS